LLELTPPKNRQASPCIIAHAVLDYSKVRKMNVESASVDLSNILRATKNVSFVELQTNSTTIIY
jgi:hypothetical protein